MRISIDNKVAEIKGSYSNVGQTLEAIQSSLPASRIVTEVLLDGTQITKLELTGILSESPEKIGDMQIFTADKQIWATNGVEMALSRVERVKYSLISSAELFRGMDKTRANQFFLQCIEGLERFVETLRITRKALCLNFQTIRVENTTLADLEWQMNHILKTILEYQTSEDYEGIADKIEFELIPNLYLWTTALRTLNATP